MDRLSRWMLPFHAVLGSFVVIVGLWMIWTSLAPLWLALTGVGVAAFLLWRSSSVGALWAWATLLLGCESLAWPIVTMVQIRLVTSTPSDEQMGAMLTAVLFGLFSSVFWIAFSYGLFRRAAPAGPMAQRSHPPPPKQPRRKKRRDRHG